MDKTQVRKAMKEKRLSITAEEFFLFNQAILSNLESLKYFQQAKHIGIYMSYKNEADTQAIIQKYQGIKQFYIPKVRGKDLFFAPIASINDIEQGYFGVLEPKSQNYIDIQSLDLMIVPLLCFDVKKNRIGYGKGFYDRTLKEFKHLTIGLGYSFQQVEDTKPHPLDIPLDIIITENNIF